MIFIAGLGNPGSKFENTRHNIGFIIIDYLAAYLNASLKPGKGQWLECLIKVKEEDVYLIKPMDYMNNSGFVIGDFFEKKNLDLNPENLLVIVDDFQIPLGTIRFRKSGSDGGHNGLSNIIYHLSSDGFPRMRIGIGREIPVISEDYVEFVLGHFSKEETGNLKKLMPVYCESILSYINNGITVAMNNFNRNHLS